MRRVYALLGLAKRYGDERVEHACNTALAADMLDVRRLERMLQLTPVAPSVTAARILPIARYLRPASQYALPFTDPSPKGEADS